jgi:HlyD family secretion protein
MLKNLFLQTITLCIIVLTTSCSHKNNSADAYGNFEAVNEIIISAEGNGKLLSFAVEEGMTLRKGDAVGLIDTTQLHLQKLQLQANIAALRAQTPDIPPQLKALQEQLSAAEREKRRVENLLKNDAATSKQLDDVTSNCTVIESQITALKSSLNTQLRGVLAQEEPLQAQINLLDNLIEKCFIINQIDGVILTKYANAFEFTATGKPLYKIADLTAMTLRVYLSEDQLGKVQIGQTCEVRMDMPDGKMKSYTGVVSWLSDKSEFTPKMIQTKNERVNLVYALKITVPNDGGIKIGMPGEVKF